MPNMEEHPVLAFFTPGSEKCREMVLTEEAVKTLWEDHRGIGTPQDELHSLKADPQTDCNSPTFQIFWRKFLLITF